MSTPPIKANSKWEKIPRYRCFSLGDFKEFERCPFSFFVKHHLEKKYQFEEGSANKALGSLLDLTIKKIHLAKAYHQPVEFLVNIVKASEIEMRDQAQKEGPKSYFGPQIPYLTPEIIKKAQDILRGYHHLLEGKLSPSISTKTFWDYQLIATTGESLKLWGGPDSIEMGEDGVVEIIDYKYFEDNERGKSFLDMELMPKLYTLLVASDLINYGHKKVRFKIRLWQDPQDNSLYEEFDLDEAENFAEFFKGKAERILRSTELSFCEKDYCRVCKGSERNDWIKEYQLKSWLTN